MKKKKKIDVFKLAQGDNYSQYDESFFKDYIDHLSSMYSKDLLTSSPRNFYDKKKSKELSSLLNFLKKNKCLPNDLTIHEVGDGGGKDSDEIFQPLAYSSSYENLIKLNEQEIEIQVNDWDLLLGDCQNMPIMIIFQNVKQRNMLDKELKNLFKKETKIFEQPRLNRSFRNNYYLECDLDWRTF